ncbi:MAG: N-acetylmuramoyl-L-alanine amidase [Arthrospira sp. SH-MAG29]|nr:N-acetylmuramoyl-L-alanine amidase [Arthrospira sp. SH-MAG29]MBS0016186.1 N-acetylmuramoyl-L-alanine amidase [Arthrospira sp. SH-MAG29]
MKRILLGLIVFALVMITPALAEQPLFVAYPPNQHRTISDRIFLIGTAAPQGEVLINGQVIDRSQGGHFAPTFPLELGENEFILRHGDQEIRRTITRISNQPPIPDGIAFVPESLSPSSPISRLPGEIVCFSAIAPPNAEVSVDIAGETIPLFKQTESRQLPDNKAVLTGTNEPINIGGKFGGCATISPDTDFADSLKAIDLGQPRYQLILNGETVTQTATGTVSILSPTQFEIAEVIVDAGVARTGPSTTYSRLTPLPKGTRARITGRDGDYLRLDYGGWIKADETRLFSGSIPPNSMIRSASSRRDGQWTKVYFPLQVPVPISIQQGDRTLTITLHNTTAQTDTIRFDDNPLIERMDWQPVLSPMGDTQAAVQYTFHFRTSQQWGYEVNYAGTTLVLSLKHPPELGALDNASFLASIRRGRPLTGVKILLDPGHGSDEDLGARGPTGYPEKDVALIMSSLLQSELIKRGATVFMTREGDDDLWPHERVEMINQQKPDLALSIHYNALPDNGDAINTKGVGMFWFHPQAHNLAVFLHNYLVEKLDRPSYGVFWNNLALTRPSVTPSVLLELGFMINPEEFEWIINPVEQRKLATTLANAIVEWVESRVAGSA